MKKLAVIAILLVCNGLYAASGPSISGAGGVSSNTVYNMIIQFAGGSITVISNNVFINNVTNNNLTVTNNAFFNYVTVTNNATFNGKVTLLSNVYVLNLSWFTNAMSTITINVQKAFEFLSTNNNVSVTGFSGIDGTNAHAFTRVFTNTASSAAVKTITLPAGTLVMSSPYSTTFYNTNQGILSGVIYPGAGTNVTWTGN